MSWTPNDGDNQSPWGAGKGSKNGSGGGNKSFNSGDYDQFVRIFKKLITFSKQLANQCYYLFYNSWCNLAGVVYRVNTDEQGVVTRFGEYVRTSEPDFTTIYPIQLKEFLNQRLLKLIELKLVLERLNHNLVKIRKLDKYQRRL